MASLSAASRSLRRPTTGDLPTIGRLFSVAAHHETHKIDLEFRPATPEGNVEKATAARGEKRLRNIMLDNNIDLYATFRKVFNCGGRGLCGTCIVEVVEGMDLLSEKTKSEHRNLKKKPESRRLACQTVVGRNIEDSGKVVVQKMPQLKK